MTRDRTGGRTGVLEILVLCLALVTGVGTPAVAAGDDGARMRETLETCFGCHGENGISAQPEFPILAGQHFYYLYVQLKDFKAGRRQSPEMAPIVAQLSKEDMRTIAQFFSEQVWPNIGYRAEPGLARSGETATVAGQCVQCHLGGYEGDSRIPRVAGQYVQYLKKTMLDFKSKVRNNSPAKSSLMKSYSAEEIADMAEFLANL